MNYDFFANSTDKIQLLEFIFAETDLQVFDLASEFSQEICQYKSSTEIAEKFDLEKGGQFSITFQLWSPRFVGEVLFRRVELNPQYCNGHTYRYSTEGWGLIQLYLGGCHQNHLHYSHIGHFEEKGALKRDDLSQQKGTATQWNWQEVKATSGKLRRQIQKVAVAKIGSYSIMRGADELRRNGVEFSL